MKSFLSKLGLFFCNSLNYKWFSWHLEGVGEPSLILIYFLSFLPWFCRSSCTIKQDRSHLEIARVCFSCKILLFFPQMLFWFILWKEKSLNLYALTFMTHIQVIFQLSKYLCSLGLTLLKPLADLFRGGFLFVFPFLNSRKNFKWSC